jgi:hypothetical protein
MAADANTVEQVVSRTLRDNLAKIQRNAEELHQAVNDMVSACASSRASNALPSMLRAQTTAASLAATLEVLSRFVTTALQPAMRTAFEPDSSHEPSLGVPPVPASDLLPPEPSQPKEEIPWPAPAAVVESSPVSVNPPPVQEIPAAPEMHSTAEVPAPSAASLDAEPDFELDITEEALAAVQPRPAGKLMEAEPVFNLDSLPPEEQELHRRAFRVAKVSMQDIRMLRPDDVKLGREKKDLCARLRDDIEKAHREYDRRFQPIQAHPVDYFYDWMVEILGGGDPQALGEYPYPSPVLRR